MADKKTSGFKTFLLIFITIILAFVFGCAAYLMLVPSSSLFGLKYASNTGKITYEYTDANKTQLLRLSDYSKIIVNANNGKGHTHVKINAGAVSGMTNSQIVLSKNTKGYMKIGAQTQYALSCTPSGSTLTINIQEPEYNFLKIANNTVLSINLYSASDNLIGTHFEINTGSGNVTIGGQVITTESAKSLTFGSANITTKSGSVSVNSVATITGELNVKSTTGTIRINGNKSFSSLSLETNTGKILTDDLTTNLSLKSFNSRVSLGNITGNVEFEMTSGILEMGNVTGKLLSDNKIKYTTVKAGKISGAVTLINAKDGNFSVNIKETVGDVAIRSGNKTIKIGKAYGKTEIETVGGTIDIAKADTNFNNMFLTTKSGLVLAKYNMVCGNNTITTTSGAVKIKFGTTAHFMLTASSEKGKVYRVWLEDKTNHLNNVAVGDYEISTNFVTISTTSGNVRLEQVK